uniref:TRP C-terminal domain-containing protein n=1 Tax=Oxyrrhis marina TaxID=2969 RepID=A0A7S4GMR7_OXYMA
MGQFLQVGFTTMSNIALIPFMCIQHPMGQSSVLQYNAVVCGTDGHSGMVIVGVLLICMGCIFLALLTWLVTVAPTKASKGDMQFLQSCRFLLFRFRVDVWWYGMVVVLRGPLLSLPAVAFTDSARAQLLSLTVVLAVSLAIQLAVWPWKTPAVNLVDGTITLLLVFVIATASAFVPAASGATKDVFVGVSLGFMSLLFLCLGVMLVMVVLALISRGPMGSAQELSVLTLGKGPDLAVLASRFRDMSDVGTQMSHTDLIRTLENLSVYDLRGLATAMTSLGDEWGGALAAHLRTSRRASITTKAGKLDDLHDSATKMRRIPDGSTTVSLSAHPAVCEL